MLNWKHERTLQSCFWAKELFFDVLGKFVKFSIHTWSNQNHVALQSVSVKKEKKNLSCRSCFTYLGLVGRLSFTSSWCFSPNWTFYQLRLVRQLKLMGWVKEVGCGALFAFLMCGCQRWQQLTNASGNNFSLVYGEFLQVQVLSFSCHNFLFPSSYVEGFPCWWEALT